MIVTFILIIALFSISDTCTVFLKHAMELFLNLVSQFIRIYFGVDLLRFVIGFGLLLNQLDAKPKLISNWFPLFPLLATNGCICCESLLVDYVIFVLL